MSLSGPVLDRSLRGIEANRARDRTSRRVRTTRIPPSSSRARSKPGSFLPRVTSLLLGKDYPALRVTSPPREDLPCPEWLPSS